MKLIWGMDIDEISIAFGYSTHTKLLKKYLIKNNCEITTNKDESDIVVWITPAGNFEPIEGKFNILYTMYETTDIPHSWKSKVPQADLVVVPCKHNQRLFKRFTKKPVDVCLEGVEIDKYTIKEREFPTDKPFTFGWFGASNQRKGYHHVVKALPVIMAKYPDMYKNMQMIFKTTQKECANKIIGYKDGEPIYDVMPSERIFYADNSIVDTRVLPYTDDEDFPRYKKEDYQEAPYHSLRGFYHYIDAFVLPSMGEGFGLTLAEAMSTGLAPIYTPWSGPVDFIDHTRGYPVKWSFTKITTGTPIRNEEGLVEMRTEHESMAASADIESIADNMYRIYSHYDTAIKKGKKAAEYIRKHITWDISAQNFMNIVNRRYEQWRS